MSSPSVVCHSLGRPVHNPTRRFCNPPPAIQSLQEQYHSMDQSPCLALIHFPPSYRSGGLKETAFWRGPQISSGSEGIFKRREVQSSDIASLWRVIGHTSNTKASRAWMGDREGGRDSFPVTQTRGARIFEAEPRAEGVD